MLTFRAILPQVYRRRVDAVVAASTTPLGDAILSKDTDRATPIAAFVTAYPLNTSSLADPTS